MQTDLTRNQMINYLIDVMGYRDEDFIGLNREEVLFYLTGANLIECVEYYL